ncbi:phage tail protein [Streptomyces mirabilis]|uniref:phage tail protein n=1 Tax=Streptomyces mirabilis TaxID=68239 RepID=UPI00367EE388
MGDRDGGPYDPGWRTAALLPGRAPGVQLIASGAQVAPRVRQRADPPWTGPTTALSRRTCAATQVAYRPAHAPVPGAVRVTAGQLGQDPAGLGKADVGALARRAVLEGTVVRRSGRIVFKDEAGKPALRWKFTNAWPKQYSASSLSGTATEVAIEELLVVEGFELGAVGHAITGQAPASRRWPTQARRARSPRTGPRR